MTGPLVLLEIAGRRCALPCHAVHSVVELGAVAPVPRAAHHVLGLFALRSSVLTVIDTAAAIGLAPSGLPAAGERVAVAEHDGHRYALAVDAVTDVADARGPVLPVPGDVGPAWQRVAAGTVETTLGPALLIDLAAIFAAPAAAAAAA